MNNGQPILTAPQIFKYLAIGKPLALLPARGGSENNEIEVTGTGTFGSGFRVRRNACGGWLWESRVWTSAAAPRCLRGALSGSRIFMGGWLLVSVRSPLRVARRLLGPATLHAGILGSTALLRPSLLPRILAPVSGLRFCATLGSCTRSMWRRSSHLSRITGRPRSSGSLTGSTS